MLLELKFAPNALLIELELHLHGFESKRVLSNSNKKDLEISFFLVISKRKNISKNFIQSKTFRKFNYSGEHKNNFIIIIY